MEAEILLQQLDLLSLNPGQISIDAIDLKIVLDHLKNLERQLADVLRLAYAKPNRARSA